MACSVWYTTKIEDRTNEYDAWNESKDVKVVGAAIVRNSSVLVAQRGEGMSLAGQWEFPGGKIKLNETPEHALKRELMEELDIVVNVGQSIGQNTVNSDGKEIELEVFLCELVSSDPHPLEHSKIRWVTHDELLHLDLASADIPLARKLVENVLIR